MPLPENVLMVAEPAKNPRQPSTDRMPPRTKFSPLPSFSSFFCEKGIQHSVTRVIHFVNWRAVAKWRLAHLSARLAKNRSTVLKRSNEEMGNQSFLPPTLPSMTGRLVTAATAVPFLNQSSSTIGRSRHVLKPLLKTNENNITTCPYAESANLARSLIFPGSVFKKRSFQVIPVATLSVYERN